MSHETAEILGKIGYYWAYGYDLTRNGPVGYIAMAYLHDTGQVAGCTVLS